MVTSNPKSFLSFLNVLILFMLIGLLAGCGNKGDAETGSSTDSGRQIVSFTASPTELSPGQNSILTVKVTNSAGVPVSNATVTFTFVTNNSGATLVTLNSGLTDAGGKALAVYTAGGNALTSNLEDTIQATCATATEAIIINRVATSLSGERLRLSASVTTLKAGENSIIEATVTDSAGSPVAGEVVTFSPMINNSGMTLTTLGTGITDASGRAIAVYTAGNNNAANDVQDTVEAEIDGGASSGAVIITRAGSAGSSVAPGYHLTLTASATSLPAGGHSVLTAMVKNSAGNPVNGLTVDFAIPSNASGATLSATSATTDAAGRAVVYYTAGNTSPDSSVQDAVSARVDDGTYSSSDAVIITRTAASFVATGYAVTVEPTPVSLVAGAMSAVVAKVSDASGNPVSGRHVSFGFSINNSGATLTDVNTTTDTDGIAVAVYTAGGNSPAVSIQDAVSATLDTGEAAAAVITRLPAVGTGNRILQFTEDPETAPDSPLGPPNNFVIMKVKVTTDDEVTPVEGIEVTFSILAGDGTLSATSATTDTNGEAFVYFTRPASGSGDTVIRAQIPGTTYGGDAARIVYWSDT